MATAWLRGLACSGDPGEMEEQDKVWVGVSMGPREEGGLLRRAHALARAAGVRQGPSSSWARLMRRAKRLRSLASCSQGPLRAAWAGPAQTTRRWTVTLSEKCTWRQMDRRGSQGWWGGERTKYKLVTGTRLLFVSPACPRGPLL